MNHSLLRVILLPYTPPKAAKILENLQFLKAAILTLLSQKCQNETEILNDTSERLSSCHHLFHKTYTPVTFSTSTYFYFKKIQ